MGQQHPKLVFASTKYLNSEVDFAKYLNLVFDFSKYLNSTINHLF